MCTYHTHIHIKLQLASHCSSSTSSSSCTHILHPTSFPSLCSKVNFCPESCADCVDAEGYHHIQPTEMKMICMPSEWYDGTPEENRFDKWRKHRISWICIKTKRLFIVFSSEFRSTSKLLYCVRLLLGVAWMSACTAFRWHFRSNWKSLPFTQWQLDAI